MKILLAPFIGVYDLIKFLIVHLATAFESNHILLTIGPFGIAIVIVTLVIRGVLFPLYRWQYMSQQNMMADQNILQPLMADLRKKYKKDPQKLNVEMQKMYKELGINPMSSMMGCIPLIIQLPIMIAVYQAIKSATTNAKVHVNFLWIPNVSKSVLQTCCTLPKGTAITTAIGHLAGYLALHPQAVLLPVLAAVLTYIQFQMIMQPPVLELSSQQQSMQGMQKNLSVFSSLIFLYLGVDFAQGLAIYWVVQSIFAVVQQYAVMGWGGFAVPEWWPGWRRTQRLLLLREERILARVNLHKSKLPSITAASKKPNAGLKAKG